RDLREPGPGGCPPGPQARRPRQAGTATARVGGADGTQAAQDPRGLLVVPSHHPRAAIAAARVVITGERCAAKVACAVRAGGRRKGTRVTGTSPTAYQRPVAQPRRRRGTRCRQAPAAPGGSYHGGPRCPRASRTGPAARTSAAADRADRDQDPGPARRRAPAA